jgi:hypothetical protein
MTSGGLGEMFEGDSADMCAGKFPIASMRGRAEGLACADTGARTPIGAIGNLPNNEGHLPFSIKHRISSILPNIVGRLPFT